MIAKLGKGISWFGLLFLGVVILVGTNWAYIRGGQDFSVFYEAWRLVLTGHGDQIYRVSPDRFLYSPGFAWLLSPMAFFPKSVALGIWCAAKAVLIALLIRKLSHLLKYKSSLISYGVCAWGIILVTRPLLIDFSYGQVNLFILGACLWGLLGHFEKEVSPFWDSVRWSLLTFAAVAKLYPLPLLIVPWAVSQNRSPHKLRFEKRAIFAAILICFLVPLLNQGGMGTFNLLLDWREAVLARGLPMESHNQSFTALLYHYLSGNPTAVLSEGARPLIFGKPSLSLDQIAFLSLFWATTSMGITLGWIISGAKHTPFCWIAVLIGLLIVPSHLIWKPYFVMSIPLSVWMLHQTLQQRKWFHFFLIPSLFVGINLTGFDFIGHHWAPHFEAASFLLLMHIALMIAVIYGENIDQSALAN